MESQKLILCKIKKGNQIKYAWLDENIAKFGMSVQIKDKGTKAVDGGWWVIRVKKQITHEKTTTQDDSEGISSSALSFAA